MSQKSAKDMFKMLLEQKKESTKCLSKAELKQLEKIEEQKLITKLKRRERYATDPEFKARQQEFSRASMRKDAIKKKEAKKGVKEMKQEEHTEQHEEPEEQYEEPEAPIPKKKINARNLF